MEVKGAGLPGVSSEIEFEPNVQTKTPKLRTALNELLTILGE